MEEYIFLNVEPVNIAVRAFQELKNLERLQNGGRIETYKQHEEEDIKTSNSEKPYISYSEDEKNIRSWAYQLGRRASAVFRMTMLRATGIDKKFWPKNKPLYDAYDTAGKQSQNLNLLDVENKIAARRYYSKYDQVFPFSIIQHKVFEKKGKKVKFGNTMLIFRKNFREVIEIETNASVKLYKRVEDGRNFKGSVKVVCTRYKIQDGVKWEFPKKLKKMIEEEEEYYHCYSFS